MSSNGNDKIAPPAGQPASASPHSIAPVSPDSASKTPTGTSLSNSHVWTPLNASPKAISPSNIHPKDGQPLQYYQMSSLPNGQVAMLVPMPIVPGQIPAIPAIPQMPVMCGMPQASTSRTAASGPPPDLFAKEEEEIKKNLALAEFHHNPLFLLKAKVAEAKLKKAKERWMKAEAGIYESDDDSRSEGSYSSTSKSSSSSSLATESEVDRRGKGKGKGRSKSRSDTSKGRGRGKQKPKRESKSSRSDTSRRHSKKHRHHRRRKKSSDDEDYDNDGLRDFFSPTEQNRHLTSSGYAPTHDDDQRYLPSQIYSPSHPAYRELPSQTPSHYADYEPDYVDYRHAAAIDARHPPAYRGYTSEPPQTLMPARHSEPLRLTSSHPGNSPAVKRTTSSENLPYSQHTLDILDSMESSPSNRGTGKTPELPVLRGKPPRANTKRPTPPRTPPPPPPQRKANLASVLPTTPPEQIERVIPMTKPVPRYPDPPVLEVVFPHTSCFLTLRQIKYDAPNAFSRVLDECRHKIRPGKKLRVPIAGRSAQVFSILQEYCLGIQITPLNSSHTAILTRKSLPSKEAYVRLHEEAKAYGFSKLRTLLQPYIRPAVDEKRVSGRKRSPILTERPVTPEPVHIYDTSRYDPLTTGDIDKLVLMTKSFQGRFLQKLPQLKTVVVDAAINFGAKLRDNSDGTCDILLQYAIAIPKRALTESLNKLLTLRQGREFDFCLEGDLTRAEAGNVALDIEHIDQRAVFSEELFRKRNVVRERHSTLREVLDGLNPIHQDHFYEWDPVLLDTFLFETIIVPSPHPAKTDGFRRKDSGNKPTRTFANLGKATVVFTLTFTDKAPFHIDIVQISAKARSVEASQSCLVYGR